MPGPTTKITDRERAAIAMIAAGLLDDWKTAYIIADAKSIKELEEQSQMHTSVSRWKTSAKVQTQLVEYKNYFATIRAKERLQAAEEEREKVYQELQQQNDDTTQDTQNNDGTGGNERRKYAKNITLVKEIDYTDPENQRKKLNQLINNAKDPGEALDALKVIIAGQKDDRQAAREQKQVRAYLPQICQDCPLYQKARARLEKGNNIAIL